MPMLAIAACLAPSPAVAGTSGWWNETALRPTQAPNMQISPAVWSPSPGGTPRLPGEDLSSGDPAVSAMRERRETVSLAMAVRRGLTINPAVRAALADADAAGTDLDIAEWGYFPTVDLSAGPEEFPFSEFGYDASARQMLYDWGRVESQVASASAAQRETRRALGVAEEEAALDITEAYLDVLAANRRLSETQQYVEELSDLESLTLDRGSNGYTDSSEQGRVALNLAQARDDLATERGAVNDARQQFRVLVGVAPDELEPPTPGALTDRLADNDALEDWIIAAPAYRQALASADQAQAKLDETEAALKPQLNLEGSLQRRQIGGELQNDSVIGLRLRMDTLQGLANFQRPDAARQRLEAARYRIDDQRRQIRRRVLTLIENAEVYRQRQQALTDQVNEAQSVSELYDDQFSVGLRDINDLLTIRQQAFAARRQLIDLASQQKRIQYRAASQLGLINPLITNRLGGRD